MRTSEYWEKRSLQLEEALHNKAEQYVHDLEEQYTLAARATQKEVLVLYNRLAANNGVSMAEAKKMLTTNELKEFRWTVDEYIKYGKENALSGEWMKELENASLRYRISRLEAMKVQMQHHAEVVMAKEVDGMTRMLSDMYTEGYYKTGHMVQSGLGIGHSFAELDTNKVDKVLSRPWAPDGKNFSERIWGQHRPQLVNDLHTGLTQMIARGESPDKLIEMISKKYNVSKKKAGNLVMTEAAYFSSKADQDSFKEMEVEEQRFVATLDSHTSDLCRDMDGKVFRTEDVIIGENAPPLHCRCRSVMTPSFEGNVQGRMARNEEGNSEVIPEDIPYHEWEEKYVKGNGKDVVKPDVKPEPKTLKERVERVKVDLNAKYDDLQNQKVELQSKNTELKITRDDIDELYKTQTDLEVKRDDYNRLKDRDFDAEIEAKQLEREQYAARVADLEKQHSRYYDRPERGTPEREEWSTWRKNVDYEELFNDLVDEKSKVVRADIELENLNKNKKKLAGIDIDEVTQKLERVESQLTEKKASAAMLKDDIKQLTDDIVDTRKGIETDYKRAGKEFISELNKRDLIGGDELEKLRKANDDAYKAYMREIDRSKRAQLSDEYVKANKAYFEMLDRMPVENAGKVKDIISQVRPTGAKNAADLLKKHLNNSRSKLVPAVTDAYSHYPTDWVEASSVLGKLSLKKVNRGFYQHESGTLAISGDKHVRQFRTAIHELGHRFERAVEDLLDIESVFYERRTKDEALQWLGGRYRQSEKSRFDDFIEAYMGKDYGGRAYEIVSMGFEYGYTDPLRLMVDADMAELIYGLLLLK